MNRSIDPDVAVLLDALETPPLSADFSDRVLAAADAAGPARPSVAQASPRRDRRRSWMPRRLLIISAGAAMALAGVSAAATGLLSEWGVEIPVVTPFVTRHLGIHHRRHHAVTPGAQRAGTIKPPTVHTATAPPLQVATPVTSPLPDTLSPPPRLAFVHPHRWRDAGGAFRPIRPYRRIDRAEGRERRLVMRRAERAAAVAAHLREPVADSRPPTAAPLDTGDRRSAVADLPPRLTPEARADRRERRQEQQARRDAGGGDNHAVAVTPMTARERRAGDFADRREAHLGNQQRPFRPQGLQRRMRGPPRAPHPRHPRG